MFTRGPNLRIFVGISLVEACRAGDLHVIRLLVECGAAVDQAENQDTPLCAASRNGQGPVVLYLLERGADKDKAAKGEMTPIHTAAFANQLGVVQCLMAAGADINKPDCDGATPLYSAAFKGFSSVVRCLADAGADKEKGYPG